MNNKIVLAVFLGLLASAAALIASLFMLQELKQTSNLPAKVNNIQYTLENLNTQIDLSDVHQRIDDLQTTVEEVGSDVGDLQVNQGRLLSYANSGGLDTDDTQTNQNENNEDVSTGNDEENTNSSNEQIEEGDKVTTTVRLNLRKDPGLKTGVIVTLKKGAVVTLLDEKKEAEGYTWLKVKTADSKIGWVAKKYTK